MARRKEGKSDLRRPQAHKIAHHSRENRNDRRFEKNDPHDVAFAIPDRPKNSDLGGSLPYASHHRNQDDQPSHQSDDGGKRVRGFPEVIDGFHAALYDLFNGHDAGIREDFDI